VIKFDRNKIKIWIHPDSESPMMTEVNDDERKKELKYQNDLYKPFIAYDSGMKEGRIGWFCSNCKGLIIKKATF